MSNRIWDWGAILLLAFLGFLILFQLNFKEQFLPEILNSDSIQKKSSGPRAEWLSGLMGVTGIHLAEYRPEQVGWEMWAPSANVRLQRYSFGVLRTRPLLHFYSPRAVIHLGAASLDIEARRVYFDPLNTEWIFVQGAVRNEKKRRRFSQLHWFPKTRRLEWPKKSPLPEIFRFWEPRY